MTSKFIEHTANIRTPFLRVFWGKEIDMSNITINSLGVQFGPFGAFSWYELKTSRGEVRLWPSRRHDDLIAKIATRYVGKEAPSVLMGSIKRLLQNDPGPFLPMECVRPAKEETYSYCLFDAHYKWVPLDLVIFKNRWEISLQEEKDYRSGYYSYSRVFITSVLRVKDRETGTTAELREEITPRGDGPNQFERHLGNEVSAMRVVAGNQILVKTKFGCRTKVIKLNLCKPT
jgi:hypothetical protein